MASIKECLSEFAHVARHPEEQLKKYRSQGMKAIGCTPYYAPEELIEAAGMVPFGLWGKAGVPKKAREYFASFYCSLAQMNMEMALDGSLDGLSAVLFSVLCDTLRPASQNFKVGADIPMLFLAHPQNRRTGYGVTYFAQLLENLCTELEKISDRPIGEEDIRRAIRIYNENRREKRRFCTLCAEKAGLISAVDRHLVMKASYFMRKEEHSRLLRELNQALEAAAVPDFSGFRVVTSGILLDSEKLLQLFDQYQLAIVGDDLAQESRGIRVDAAEEGDPIRALALQFSRQNQDPLLYDPTIYSRSSYIKRLIRDSHADGLVQIMMVFCDPEELEFPDLSRAVSDAGASLLKLSYSHEMMDFGQAETSLETFAAMLSEKKEMGT